MRRLCMSLAVLALMALGCGQSDQRDGDTAPGPLLNPADMDAKRAMEEVRRFTSLGPKVSGTSGAAAAARYLKGRLRALGIDAGIDVFTDASPSGVTTFRNVIGILPGNPANGIVVLASHYDTKYGIGPRFAGANDSGSSTGLLLELARLLSRTEPAHRPEIQIAFFDGEECRDAYADDDGLHGSQRLAATLQTKGLAKRVKAVIIMDMIGDKDLSVTIPKNCDPALVKLALAAAREEQARLNFSWSRRSFIDDHVPFRQRRMPAIDLIDFEYGSSPGKNDYWHTDADTIDKLSQKSLNTVGRVVIRMLNEISNASN